MIAAERQKILEHSSTFLLCFSVHKTGAPKEIKGVTKNNRWDLIATVKSSFAKRQLQMLVNSFSEHNWVFT